jgi:hypothetical protein
LHREFARNTLPLFDNVENGHGIRLISLKCCCVAGIRFVSDRDQ